MRAFNGANAGRVYTAADLGLTASSGWTITDSRAVISGRIITLRLNTTYGGATVTAGTSGNITDSTVASRLADAYKPPGFAVPLLIYTAGLNASGYLSASTGNVVITAINPNGSLVSGDRYIISATWDLP